MTKALQRIRVNLPRKNSSCVTHNGVFDFERLRLLADGIKPFLGLSLENRIHSGLEEFVCKPSSRYSRRFPRVKRCLDAVAAWLNYLDAFRANHIEQEAIKHAIEYLLEDDRVTHFEDPLVPNTRMNKAYPDSLTEQNAMKSLNVWNFIKEKDFWLCQDQVTGKSPLKIHPQFQEYRKESGSSDLDVEIGSSSIGLSVSQRLFTSKPCCNKKTDNLKSPKSKTQHDQKITCSPKQDILNSSKEVCATVDKCKLPPTRNLSKVEKSTKIQSDCNQICDQSTCPKRSKLKVVVHKATSTNRDLPKVTNVSIPCKSSHLIVRLFEADPSLSDSCLILIKRKFEHDISNACSCMNDILKKLDYSTIRRLCLNCRICPGRIDLNLQRDDTAPKARMFLARVPICLNVHKRESSRRNVESSRDQHERSRGPNENSDVLNQCCANRKEFQEREFVFYSQCSNQDLMEQKRTSSKDNMRKEWGKEVNFVWLRREPREVDFVLSSCFTEPQSKESFKENCVQRNFVCSRREPREVDFVLSSCFTEPQSKESCKENCVETAGKINDENREVVCDEEETRGDEKNDTCVNALIIEDDHKKLDHLICSCSSNNSGGEHAARQDDLPVRVCDTEHYFGHVFFANNESSELNNIEQKDSVKEKTTSQEKCNSQCQNNIIEKNDGPAVSGEAKESIFGSKNSIVRIRDVSKLERNIVTVRSSNLRIQATLVTTEIEKNVSETEENARTKESYSEDSNCSSISKITKTSYDSKCSHCGKDLSDEEVKNVSNCIQPDIFNTEAHGTLNSASTKNTATKELTKTPSVSLILQPPKSKTFVMKKENFSRNSNDGDRDPETRLINENPESCKCSNDLNSKSSNRTNRKQFPCESNSSAEAESISEKNLDATTCQTNVEAGSKCVRKPNCFSSSSKTRCKSKEDTSCRRFPRRKNNFWKRSIVPGSLCNSFPALDRIKYLIRKKLRRLLMEERDRGTSTSKTYLRNDRYLVSISSGKLNNGRVCSSIYCPFTARNRLEVRYPQKTFAEASFLAKKEKKEDVLEECVVGRCRRIIRDNEVFKKFRVAEISRFLGQKCGSKIDDHRKIDEKEEVHSFHRDGKRTGRSSVTSFGSTRVIFFEEDVDKFSSSKTKCKASYERCYDLTMGKLSKETFREEIASPNPAPRKNRRGSLRVSVDKDRGGRERGDALPDRRSKFFDKRLFKRCKVEDCDEDNDFINLLNSYEKRISDLDADFRLKLLQYVALCRSVKDLLMKRLPRPDDV